MNAVTAERNEFAPPPQRGMGRALALALLAHGLLILAFAWGLNWRTKPQDDAIEAELWAPTVQQAAPRAAARPPEESAQPPVPAPPAPEPLPAPVPRETPSPPPPVADTAQRDAEIALAEKKKQEQERMLRVERERREAEAKKREQEKLAQQKAAEDKKRQQEEQRKQAEVKKREQEKLAQQKAAEDKKRQQEEQRKQAEAKKREQEKLAAEKKAADAKAAAAREARESEVRRKAELKRLAGLAGDGDGTATSGTTNGRGSTPGGNAEREASPSAGYAGRIRAAVRPNIVFTEDVPGDPVAVVQVQTGPTGAIIARRIIKSSGVKAWDDAVLRALDRTEKLPSDNGRYWNPVEIVFRLRD